MMRRHLVFGLALFLATGIFAEHRLSEDRDLLDVDLSGWNCADKLEGTAKTPDGIERNRLKNRSAGELAGAKVQALDTIGFLKQLADFESQTKGKRRKDIAPAQRAQLDALEKQVVSLTGYLVIAYAGPPESTNCGNVDFHDWHLEVFEKPSDHAPQPGDPTPIICEITPRTQRAIYRDNIRVQSLAGFFRKPDLTYEPTGHKAQKIRATGYLLWDDEHNGTADVGTNVRTGGANHYHNPWRSTAWEIHPVVKLEPADGLARSTSLGQPTPAPVAVETPPPPPVVIPTATPKRFVTITQPVKIKIPYGETVLQRGTKWPIAAQDAQTVTVEYMGAKYVVPIASTDLAP